MQNGMKRVLIKWRFDRRVGDESERKRAFTLEGLKRQQRR